MRDARLLTMTSPWQPSTSGVRPDPPSSALPGGNRFMLWIDAVGGYLFCLGDRVLLGQAAPGSQAEMAIQADISRRHAQISRLADGYVIEPLSGQVAVNHRLSNEPTPLSDGAEIQLGASVKLRFCKAHALSGSARLEIVSGHRTAPHADAIVLMAESCVLGPKRNNHVVCHGWSSDVVLYRSDDRLMCRSLQPLEIDGRSYEGRASLQPGNRVAGSDFTFTVEAV